MDISVLNKPKNIPKTELDYTENFGDYYFGNGFNSFTGKSTGTCISYNNKETVNPNGSGKKVIFEIQQITNQLELNRAFSLEAGAGFRFGLGAIDGKAKFAKDLKIYDYSIFILAKVEVLNPEISISNYTLTPFALDILKGMQTDKFLQACGNEFVEGISYGASIYAVFEFETKSKSEYLSKQAQLKASFGIFSNKINFSQNISKLVSFGNIKFKFFQQGGPTGESFKTDLSIPQEKDEVISFIESFAANVTLENSVPIKARTSLYNAIVPLEFEINEDLQNQKNVLEFLEKKRIHYLHAQANYSFITANSKDFSDGVNLEDIKKENAKIISLKNKVTDYARECIKDFKNCHFPEDLIEISPFLPQELSTRVDCEFKEAKACGVESIDFKIDGEICGYNTVEMEHESCSVDLYNFREHEDCLKPENAKNEFISKETIYKEGTGPGCEILEYKEGKSGSKCGFHSCGFGLIKKCQEKTCRHPDFGVASYKPCRLIEFGVERYPICRAKEFGVEKYKKCPVQIPNSCKVTKFKSCWVFFSQRYQDYEVCPLFAVPRS